MISVNPKYESFFDIRNIDDGCDKIGGLMKEESNLIREALNAGLDEQAVTMYLQLLKSMCDHFVKDEHYCYFDDLYSPEFVLQSLFEGFQMHDLSPKASVLLKQGHDEIIQTECFEDYGYPSYL